jgi:hypothetical protein
MQCAADLVGLQALARLEPHDHRRVDGPGGGAGDQAVHGREASGAVDASTTDHGRHRGADSEVGDREARPGQPGQVGGPLHGIRLGEAVCPVPAHRQAVPPRQRHGIRLPRTRHAGVERRVETRDVGRPGTHRCDDLVQPEGWSLLERCQLGEPAQVHGYGLVDEHGAGVERSPVRQPVPDRIGLRPPGDQLTHFLEVEVAARGRQVSRLGDHAVRLNQPKAQHARSEVDREDPHSRLPVYRQVRRWDGAIVQARLWPAWTMPPSVGRWRAGSEGPWSRSADGFGPWGMPTGRLGT